MIERIRIFWLKLKNKIFKGRINDKEYLELMYFYFFKKPIDLENPKTLNEKIQWLKLYDRKEKYSVLVDKYNVKKYIENIIGSEYVIKTLGVYERFNDINFDKLPNRFVIKCTHDSGSTVVCEDKTSFDIKEAKKRIEDKLKINYYEKTKEWAYKNVKPQIIIEENIEELGDNLTDYKFYCFNGNPNYVLLCMNRKVKPEFYFFDKEWNFKKFNRMSLEKSDDFTVEKPRNMDKMFELAEILARDTGSPFIRIDMYNVRGKIYFGEYTFYPDAGFDTNRLPEFDLFFGSMIDLKKGCRK